MRNSGCPITLLAAATVLLSLAPGGRAIAGPWDMDTTYGDAGLVAYDPAGAVQVKAAAGWNTA